MPRKISDPVMFQGNKDKKNYFEGWYYKNVSRDKKHMLSIIPGISLFSDDSHSFIQYIYARIFDNGEKFLKTGYIRYLKEDFQYGTDSFYVDVSKSSFKTDKIYLDIKDENISVKGELKYSNLTPIKKSFLMPDIMGFFSYFPIMECYHGVISMGHEISGKLEINGESADFEGGRGYLEKDWGKSFPSDYIWVQCNNFPEKETGIIFSVANIPFAGTSFRGFLCNIVVDNNEYRFATYNRSKHKILNKTNKSIEIQFENNKAKLFARAEITDPGELIAPVSGSMERKIKEELMGTVYFRLEDKITGKIFESTGSNAGIEISDKTAGE